MKKLILIISILFIIGAIIESTTNKHYRYKKYVIEHASDIRKTPDDLNFNNSYKIDECELSYYTDVTIRMDSDSSYNIIFWGDRKSWLWKFQLDTYFTVNVPYKIYNGENVDVDLELIKVLKDVDEL